MKLEVELRSLRLARPLHTAYGAIAERPLVLIALKGDDGIGGYGEAAPLQPYDGVSVGRVCAALKRHAAALQFVSEPEDCDPRQLAGVLDACRAADALPAALAAIDMALWDRAGRLCESPVAALLSERPAAAVPVNATLTARERPALGEQAADALAQGFGCVKLKVGLEDDAGRAAAVRAAVGPAVQLRLDANGAWSVAQAARAIAALAPARPELIEEPVHGLRALRELRRLVDARFAIDETAAEEGALQAGVADAVCLKLSRCAGITGTLAAAATVRASGAEPYLASTLDGPLGIAAALHAAAAISASGPMPHCGLATLALFERLENPLPVSAGEMALPSAPGLGVAAA